MQFLYIMKELALMNDPLKGSLLNTVTLSSSQTLLKKESILPCLGSFFPAFLFPPFPLIAFDLAGGFLVAGALELQ